MLDDTSAYNLLTDLRASVERDALIPLESLIESISEASREVLGFRRSIDDLITYLTDKLSSFEVINHPDDGSVEIRKLTSERTEDPEGSANPAELQRAKATWGWLSLPPGGWPSS